MRNFIVGYIGNNELKELSYGHIIISEAEKYPTLKELHKIFDDNNVTNGEVISISEITSDDLKQFERE